jgi:hypothetical protein
LSSCSCFRTACNAGSIFIPTSDTSFNADVLEQVISHCQ